MARAIGSLSKLNFVRSSREAKRRVARHRINVRPIILLIWIILNIGGGQALALDPERSVNQYLHSVWKVTDGAPSRIVAITQSADGFLWLGSASGLYRFDGMHFEHVAPIAGDRSRSQQVTALFAARNGDIWVGYDYGGIAIYHDGILRDANHGPPTGSVLKFVQTQDGAIWVATWGIKLDGLSRFLDGRWTTIDPGWGLGGHMVSDILAAGDGTLWVATYGPVMRLPAGSRHFEASSERNVSGAAIAQDRQGSVWVSDTKGIRKVSVLPNAKRGPVPYPALTYNVLSLLIDRDGGIWGTDQSTGLLHIGKPLVTRPGPKNSAPHPDVFRANAGLSSDVAGPEFEDREGNIWIGTALGLDRFRAANLVQEKSINIDNADVFVMLQSPHGLLIRNGNQVFQVDGKYPAPLTRQLKGTVAFPTCARQTGEIFLGTSDKLLVWQNGKLHRQGLPPTNGELHGSLSCAVDSQNRLWIGIARHGLFRLDGMRWTRVVVLPDRPDAFPWYIHSDRQGRILLYYALRGLFRIDGDKIEPLWMGTDISVGFVKAIYAGPRYLVIGGEQGIARLVGQKFQFLDASHYAWLRNVTGIAETGRGETWLLSSAGVMRLRTDELDAAFLHPGRPLNPTFFTISDGLPGVVQPYGNADAAEDGLGRIWFLTSQGVAWINPARLQRNPIPPPVIVRMLIVDGRTYVAGGAVKLPAGSTNLEFDFAALSLSVPERVRVRYRLIGFDKGWIDPGLRRQAFYSSLAPGEYTFSVIAANADGVWNAHGATQKFTIPPTFLQSRIFLLLCIVLVTALLWLLHNIRLRQISLRLRARLDERMRERERIARNLHDTLLQTMQGAILRFQSVANQLPHELREQSQIDHALDRADGVMAEGRNHLFELRSTFSDRDLQEILSHAVADVLNERAVQVRVMVEGAKRPLVPIVQDEIALISQEALANSLQHARASQIIIKITYGDRQFAVEVQDDGCGLDQAVLEKGGREGHFGLKGMAERAERIKAALTIASNQPKGTQIGIQMPARLAYRDAKAWNWRIFRAQQLPSDTMTQ